VSFWKLIFGKGNQNSEESKIQNKTASQFRKWVIEGIGLMGSQGAKMENEDLHNLLVSAGIPEVDTEEIIIFLPTAICKKLLPEIEWPEQYIDYYSENKQIKRKYKENQRYLIIEEEVQKYWKTNLGSEVVQNIAGRSAEFNAINKMLHSGGKLENVMLAESRIFRYE